jgi:hypothetical protein
MPQLVTAEDRENYCDALIDMTQRAAVEALSPEIAQLRAENQQLRAATARSQRDAIERALDRSLPTWRQIYQDPTFADWLSQPDDYSGNTRSQLLRNAVANGDAARVVAFYRGFHHAPGPRQQARSRQGASGSRPVYTRQQIANLYERRRKGEIDDARWARIEADIIAAASEGRVTSSFDKFGNEMRLR